MTPANQSTPEVTRAVAVTQADRAAAAALIRCGRLSLKEMVATDMEEGRADDSDVVQAFARHRLAHATPARGGDELREEWDAAYRAFVGAFDTAVARRKDDNDFSRDARKRLRRFDEAFRAALASTDMAGAGEGNSRPTSPLGHARACLRTAGETSHVQIRRADLQWIIDRFPVCDPDAAPPVEGLMSGEGDVEQAAKALGLYRIPGGDSRDNPPTRWPSTPQDTLSGRDGTVPLTWDFAERCRADVRVVLDALAASPKATATASVREAMRFAETVKAELIERAPAYSIQSVERAHFDRGILAIAGLLRVLTDSGTAATIGGARA